MRVWPAILVLSTSLYAGEAEVRRALARGEHVRLPAGVHDVSVELQVPAAVRIISGSPSGTTLRMAKGFQARSLLRLAKHKDIRLTNFAFDGQRTSTASAVGFPPSNRTFAGHVTRTLLAVDDCSGVTLDRLSFRYAPAYAVLITASQNVKLNRITVLDSGARNAKGFNDGSGGILLEDGTGPFAVESSVFRRVLGNAIWTHSRLDAKRNGPGRIALNTFDTIGRDAIQVGHASGVSVERNSGTRIGYPHDAVDTESGGIPVAIDTAGNVDRSRYNDNRFRELNGKCIDLDGFHHGEVARNTCSNSGEAKLYPSGHYGIVFNNNNPQMRSEEVHVHHNHLSGMKYGGVFLLGARHRIIDNRFEDINRAGCPESHARFGCLYFPGQPELLSSGIYLGVSAADWSRQEPSTANVITGNLITGHGMSKRCVVAAPAVNRTSNTIEQNICREAAKAK